MNNRSSKQYPLDWDYTPSHSLEDYLLSSSNELAYAAIKDQKSWASHALCIYGPASSGKTHLAYSFSELTSSFHVKGNEELSDIEAHNSFVVEDVDQNIYDEHLLFHLFNWSKENGGYLLLTARSAPSKWNFELPDLKSRIGLMDVKEIAEPDDDLLEKIYYKLFSDRQISIDPSLIKFLLVHVERSFEAAENIVVRLDQEALSKKCKVSRQLAASLLK
ncbi:hypothetical protein QGN29_11520 [Temperatibacter marinus]|uniref:DnaA regulatory inactivator Hda n=1 Tax=Temperatibacter marinus TaxID=1456591 RepID=A0AA52EGN0_9PROT|nr:hypothetical protein [Temperatibacter marinus]WND02179.1 hypothetical protein QGN29_11520 [Temperatibacter marinus]